MWCIILFWPSVWGERSNTSISPCPPPSRQNRVGCRWSRKEADIATGDFKDLFPFYFSSIFFVSFFTSTELGLGGFPRRAGEMDGSLRGAQGRRLRPANEG